MRFFSGIVSSSFWVLLASSTTTVVHAKAFDRSKITSLIAKNPTGHQDASVRQELKSLLQAYAQEENVDPNDVVFAIGDNIYGVKVDFPQTKQPEEEDDDDSVIIDFDYMQQFMQDVFLSYGVTPEHALTASEVLIEADKRGIDSHGLGRLKPIYCDRMDAGILYPDRPVEMIKETETTAFVNGNLGLGLYIGPYCMKLAIEKAKKYGVGFVVCKDSTHYGIAGYYTGMAADHGCIGWSGTNARPSIAPTFGSEPMLGTNPMCFAMPTNDGFHFNIDCATSINQRGKIEYYERAGKPTPKGCVIDDQGIERTDTVQILKDMVLGKCCLTPMGGAGEDLGGYKGFGWATTIELLSTAFQSGPFGEEVCGIDRKTGKKKPMPLGHFFLAIDIEHICPLDVFKKNASALLKAIRESKKSPTGPGRIWTAGEKEHDARVERMAQGGMKVPKVLQENMKTLRDTRPGLKDKYPKLPFE